jgi:hypothetical protein
MQPPQLLHNEPHISPTLFPPCPPSLQSSSLSSLPLSSFNWRLQEIFSVSTVLLYLSGCTLGRSCYRPPKHWTAVRGCPCPAIFLLRQRYQLSLDLLLLSSQIPPPMSSSIFGLPPRHLSRPEYPSSALLLLSRLQDAQLARQFWRF